MFESEEKNPYMEALRQARRQGAGGIDPDLVPYLEEANRPSSLPLTDISHTDEETREHEALHMLMENSLLAGPLPTDVLNDIENEEKSHDSLLSQAGDQVELNRQVDGIYHNIMSRAPEHDISPTRKRIEHVLYTLGDPQLTYPTIHITGTNGKTSVSRMIDALATEYGVRTGRFTSPHLHTPRERISFSGESISQRDFISIWEDISPIINMCDQQSVDKGYGRLSFFEYFTAMAFQAFADRPVDLGIIEVGMGGEWDATNVINSSVQVITPISHDHEKWLGHSIEEIAETKSGIIKSDSTVIAGRQPQEALDVIERVAYERGARVRLLGRDIEVVNTQQGVGGIMVSVHTPAATYEDIFVPLLGQHQAENAALALGAYEAMRGGDPLDPGIVERGFMSVTSPGRLEVVRSSPTVIVDAAHNPGGAHALRQGLEDSFTFTHLVGVFAGMADKDTETVLGELEPLLDSLVVTTMPTDRALDIDQAQEIASDVFGPDRVQASDSLADALDMAVSATEQHIDPTSSTGVIVFGSVVLAGMTREIFGRREA